MNRWVDARRAQSIRFIAGTALTWVTFAWFVFFSGALIVGAVLRQILGGDAVLYAAAASAWLAGEDPWLVTIPWAGGTVNPFAAPPTSLLPFVPFSFLPPVATAAFWVAADVVAIVLVVRRLRLPWLWCLFPPAVDAAVLGNPEPVMLAILVLAPSRLAGLAVLVKVYAGVPLLASRRWGALALALVLGLLSLPLLPWREFFEAAPRIAAAHATQSGGGLSAWAVPILIPFAVIGLALVGPRRAGWLVVPVLWPFAQLHYATIALPRLSIAGGLLFSLPIPGATAVGAIVLGAIALASRWIGTSPRDTNAGSGGATSGA